MPIDLMPRKFFVTSGTALSDISEMNAFDQALVEAGIAEANLVPVSSIFLQGRERNSRKNHNYGSQREHHFG